MRIMFVINDLGVNEPFGPMALSAVLKERGHQANLGVIKKEDLPAKIDAWKPDVLAYSMMSVDMHDMRKFNFALRKKKQIFTILGGAHPTMDRNCVNDSGVDAICIGEGEDAISQVVDSVEKGQSLEGIPNIMLPGGDLPRIRPLIEDFDSYPFMDRELVYQYPESGRFGIKGVWASRGCAFPCPYCFNNRVNRLFSKCGRVVRRRNVESLIRETEELIKNYRVDFVRIQDDVFVYQADLWLEEFVDKWSQRVQKPFYCLLRSELVTDRMAFYLKKAGCFSICMSIESGNDQIRTKMMRRNVEKKKLEEAFAIFKKHKINIYANSMLALPFTSIAEDIESVDFAIKVQPQMPNFSIFMPYPGTDLGDYCNDVGIYNPKEDSITYGMRNLSPLKCFTKNQKEVQYNLCELAIVAIKLPFLRNLIVRHLIYWKPNKVFFLIHYIFAVTSYGKKIFYFKHSLFEYFGLIVKTFKHYLYDFMKKETKEQKAHRENLTCRPKALSEEKRRAELKKCLEAMSLKKEA